MANVSELNGLFKEAYGNDLIGLVPEAAKLKEMIKFVSAAQQTGNLYHQPVIVRNEHGATYGGTTGDAFALNDPISMSTRDAQIQGSDLVLRGSLSYGAAAKASNGKKAFKEATMVQLSNLAESAENRLEMGRLYGGSGLAKIASSANSGLTSTVLTVKASEWSAGLWAGMEACQINFYNGSTLVSSGADAVFTVGEIDPDNRTVEVTGTQVGITALDAAVLANPNVLDVYFKGAFGMEMVGLKRILTNTGSLFNIDASTYNLWKANQVSYGSGTLTFGRVLRGVGKAVARGLTEKVMVLVNPDTWQDLATDLAALRVTDSSYSSTKIDQGTQNIKYYGQNGEVEIVSHIFMKAGDCFVVPPKRLKRIGAQELSFKTPGREDEIFTQLANNAGFEYRCYANEGLLLETPAKATLITGFVNSTLS